VILSSFLDSSLSKWSSSSELTCDFPSWAHESQLMWPYWRYKAFIYRVTWSTSQVAHLAWNLPFYVERYHGKYANNLGFYLITSWSSPLSSWGYIFQCNKHHLKCEVREEGDGRNALYSVTKERECMLENWGRKRHMNNHICENIISCIESGIPMLSIKNPLLRAHIEVLILRIHKGID